MSQLDEVVKKIPKPLLVGGVLVLALAFFVYNEPLRDECEVQAKIFQKSTAGVLSNVRKKTSKIQFAQIKYWQSLCTEGNSIGACEEYLNGLKLVAAALKSFKNHCQLDYVEKNEDFLVHIKQGILVMSLLAWGEKPPEGLSSRLGWLTEVHLKTFCSLKSDYIRLAGDEKFLELRNEVYGLYPDKWPEKVAPEARDAEQRPKALKSAGGTLDAQQIYERSLFSIRCDLYL